MESPQQDATDGQNVTALLELGSHFGVKSMLLWSHYQYLLRYYFTYWDIGREVLNAQNEMLGLLWSPSRPPLSMMAGPFCGTAKILAGRQLEFRVAKILCGPTVNWMNGLWGMAMERCKWWLPIYRTKFSLRQGSGGIGDKGEKDNGAFPAVERPDFTSKKQASRMAEQLRCTECEKVNVRFYCRCSFLE